MFRMKFLLFILLFPVLIYTQDSKKITQKFFPDFDIVAPTPAFNKKKGFTKYDEMMSFIDALVVKYPEEIRYEFIGKSQKGKDIPIVYLGNHSSVKTKVCFMGGLHGNEPASTEGMLLLIYNILNIDSLSFIKENIDLAIIPMANIDGYEKQSRYAANGQDLNRDQTKFTNQESIHIKTAVNKFSPQVMVDFHEYKPYRVDYVNFGEYGVTSQYDCMFLYSGNLNVSPEIKEAVENLYLPPAKEGLDFYELTYHNYLSSKHRNNQIYFNLGSVSPRSSATSYALSNSISMLMEVRGVGLNKTSFSRRVFTTYFLANSFLRTSIEKSKEIKAVIKNSMSFPEEVVIKYEKEKTNYTLDMIDVYQTKIVPVNVLVNNSLKCEPVLTRKRPKYYLIDSSLTVVVEKLIVLGLEIDTLEFDELLQVESYEITSQKKSPIKFQGFYENIVNTTIVQEEIIMPKGTFIVPMNQKRSNIAVETLEPEMLSGFLRFNVIQPIDINKIHRYTLNKVL